MTGILTRISVLGGIFFLLASRGFCAEKEEVRPTFAKESHVQLTRGETVPIEIQAVPDYGNQITFEIQKLPQHGHLSTPANDSDHSATVIYQHDGSKLPLEDEFSFRAQAPGHAKSPACTVHITVVPPPAKLIFEPKELDFGSLTLGDHQQTNVLVHNVGGTTVAGNIMVPKGYSILEGGNFSLNEGESCPVSLEFDPAEVKDYSSAATLVATCDKEVLVLKGVGLARFEVTKTSPQSCRVKNLSAKTLSISFQGEGSWIMPPETTLPPHAERDFHFQEAESDDDTVPNSLSAGVKISDGESSTNIELPATQGFIPLTVSNEGSSTPGNIEIGTSLSVKFSLLNRSENSRSAVWVATSSSGGGMPATLPLELKGGEAKEMQFEWRPTQPGSAVLKISVDEGTKTHHELLWKTTVVASSPDGVSPPPAQSPVNQTSPADSTPAGVPVGDENRAKIIPEIEDVRWSQKIPWWGKPSITLQCGGGGDGRQFRIEEQILRVGVAAEKVQGDPASAIPPMSVDLVPVQSVLTKSEKDQAVIRVSNLSPGWHLVVISRVSNDGATEAQSKVQVFMPQKPSAWSHWRVPLGALMILLMAIFLRSHRKWLNV